MTDQLQKAKSILEEKGYTCVMCKDEELVYTRKRGVASLLEWLDSGRNFSDFSAADKVVGKAAAMLYVLMKVKDVYAFVISRGAIDVFEKYGIDFNFDSSVDVIKNRTGTGFCPMEEVTHNINDPVEAKKAVEIRLKQLSEEKRQ